MYCTTPSSHKDGKTTRRQDGHIVLDLCVYSGGREPETIDRSYPYYLLCSIYRSFHQYIYNNTHQAIINYRGYVQKKGNETELETFTAEWREDQSGMSA